MAFLLHPYVRVVFLTFDAAEILAMPWERALLFGRYGRDSQQKGDASRRRQRFI
jgi:hypothetical protein